MKHSLIQSLNDFKKLYPRGDIAYMVKEPDVAKSDGGVIIPDAHQEYRRRGWCLVPGGGRQINGKIFPNQFKNGDYLICDREFVRPDEKEDEITKEMIDGHEVVTVLIRGDEILAFESPDTKPAPDYIQKIITRFANQ